MVSPVELSRRRSAAFEFSPLPRPGSLHIPLVADALNQARAPGSRVIPGDALCEPGGPFSSAPAPLAGVVGQIGRGTLLGGAGVDLLELKTLAPDPRESAEFCPVLPAPISQNPKADRAVELGSCIARLLAAGVDAQRTTSPNLLGQLAACINHPADTLILNVFDVEAHLPLAAALLQSSAGAMAAALSLLAMLCGVKRTLVVVGPGTRAKSLAEFESLVRMGSARLMEVNGDYPLSDPTILLHTLTQRHLRPGDLPTAEGVLLLDAAAAAAVGHLVLRGQPMLSVPLAVRDHVERVTYLLSAPVGMAAADLCAALEVPVTDAQLRAGEFLRQLDVAPDAVIGPGELALHISAAERAIAADPCLRCGWCVDACPTGVHPAFVLEAAQRQDRLLADRYGLDACIQCGICAYVCPSRLPLLRAIRTFAVD